MNSKWLILFFILVFVLFIIIYEYSRIKKTLPAKGNKNVTAQPTQQQKTAYEKYKQKVLGDVTPPKALEKLFYFERKEKGYYSQNFELDTFGDDVFEYEFEETPEKETEYRKYIKPFTTVDGTGGFAAFWVIEPNDLDNAPIIVYGSEGLVKVVAKNLLDFMRMLTFDTELMDGVSSKFANDYTPSPYKQAYIDFLKKEFGIEPVRDLEPNQKFGNSPDNIQILKEAEDLYKERFMNWQKEYYEIDYNNRYK